MDTYACLPVCFVHGSVVIFGMRGKIPDWVGDRQNALGHSILRLWTPFPPSGNPDAHLQFIFNAEQARLAQLLCELSFADKVFFVTAGPRPTRPQPNWPVGGERKTWRIAQILTLQGSFTGVPGHGPPPDKKRSRRVLPPFPRAFVRSPLVKLALSSKVLVKKPAR
jgi:hypothetical protein